MLISVSMKLNQTAGIRSWHRYLHDNVSWGEISWTETRPQGTEIVLQTRTGNTPTPDGSWSSWSDDYTDPGGGAITSPGARYIQYRATLCTENLSLTPALHEVCIAKPVADAGVRVAEDVVRVAVILAEPSDDENEISTERFGERISPRFMGYWDEVSYGALAVRVSVYDNNGEWYKLKKPSTDYITDRNEEKKNYTYKDEFVKDVIEIADLDVNFTPYTLGSKSAVIVVGTESLHNYRLRARALGYRNILGWWWIEASTDEGKVSNLALVSEYDWEETWAHEFAHILGRILREGDDPLPELYPEGYTMGDIGSWGLMGSDPEGGAPSRVHLSSWSKVRLGWLKYSGYDLTQIVSYHNTGTLNALSTMEYGDSLPYYKAKEWLQADLQNIFLWFADPPSKKATFYLLETRTGEPAYSIYDQSVPGDGLVVYQVNLTRTATETIIRVNVVENKLESILELVGIEDVSPTWLTTGESYFLESTHGLIKISALDNTYDPTTFAVDVEVAYPVAERDPITAILDPIPYQVESSIASALGVGQTPDLDLHAYTPDNKHVGVNYSTGEYEIQIPDTITSGDMFEGTEWISVPENVEVHFVVSSKDTAEFMEASPGTLENENGLYILEVSYSNGDNYYLSPAIGQAILPGAELYHSFDLTQNPDGTYSVEAKQGMDLLSLEAWQAAIDNIPDNVFIRNPTQRKQALKEKFEEVFEEISEAQLELAEEHEDGDNEDESEDEEEDNEGIVEAYEEAIEKLEHDILKKLDADGQADWVRQPTLYNEVKAFVAILRAKTLGVSG